VNDLGWIAGVFVTDPVYSVYSFFLYRCGKMQDIGLPPSQGFGSIYSLGGMNDRGQIVASEIPNGGPGFDYAYLYENGNWQDIQQFIDPSGPWEVTDALGINNSGEIIGFGVFQGPTGYTFPPILLVPGKGLGNQAQSYFLRHLPHF
jgi:hypothetical protein